MEACLLLPHNCDLADVLATFQSADFVAAHVACCSNTLFTYLLNIGCVPHHTMSAGGMGGGGGNYNQGSGGGYNQGGGECAGQFMACLGCFSFTPDFGPGPAVLGAACRIKWLGPVQGGSISAGHSELAWGHPATLVGWCPVLYNISGW